MRFLDLDICFKKRLWRLLLWISAAPSAISLSLLFGLRWLQQENEWHSWSGYRRHGTWALCFDLCSHFRIAYHTHYMCAPCRHNEGHQEYNRDLNFQYCINWSGIEWSLHESNLQQKGKKRQKKLDKMQRQSLQKTPWQLALKIQKARQQRNQRWKILEVRSSLLTRVLSKRIAVPWDTVIRTMRRHQHLSRGWRETMIGGHEDQNCPSDRGQDDTHRVRNSHKRSSSSRSSNGSSAGSSPSRSRSLAESRADCPAGVGSSGNWTNSDEGPAGVDSSQRWTTVDRSPAGVGSFWNWTTAGEGPAGASSSWSSTTMDHPAGVGFLRVADYHRQTLWTWFRDFFLCQGRFFCHEVQSSRS